MRGLKSEIRNMSILIAMSGGVDSSVAAYLMSEKYKACKGATMLLCGASGTDDARVICEKLGIDFEVLDYRAEFDLNVITPFITIYESGGTPNPCITCNETMKFGKFLTHAHEINLEKIATGHYAKIEFNSGRYLLRKAKDLTRDQSYVLYMLTQEQLKSVEFPLGDFTKKEVREMAEGLNFVNAKKSDSQDICFVPDGDYGKFIEDYTGKKYKSGNFVNEAGKILGTHKGIIHYTLGQRKGLGVAAETRLYISKMDLAENTITLSSKNLLTKKLIAEKINLIPFEELPKDFEARVKVRYGQKEIPATINQINEKEMIIEFQEKIKAPARGQSAVIYDGEYVIGGGIIKCLL